MKKISVEIQSGHDLSLLMAESIGRYYGSLSHTRYAWGMALQGLGLRVYPYVAANALRESIEPLNPPMDDGNDSVVIATESTITITTPTSGTVITLDRVHKNLRVTVEFGRESIHAAITLLSKLVFAGGADAARQLAQVASEAATRWAYDSHQ